MDLALTFDFGEVTIMELSWFLFLSFFLLLILIKLLYFYSEINKAKLA